MVNLKGSFQFAEERSRTLLFAQYVEDFCACTQFFDVCQQTVHKQRVRSLNIMRTVCSSEVRKVCSSAVRQRFVTSTVELWSCVRIKTS